MEFKLKDEDGTKEFDPNSQYDEISEFSENQQTNYSGWNDYKYEDSSVVNDNYGEVYSPSLSTLSILGTLGIIIGVFLLVILAAISVIKGQGRKILRNSTEITGEIISLGDVTVDVERRSTTEKTKNNRTIYKEIKYQLSWYQDIDFKMVDEDYREFFGTLNTKIKTRTIVEKDYDRELLDEAKTEKIESPFRIGDKYQLYMNKKDTSKIYFKQEVDSMANPGPIEDWIRIIGAVCMVGGIMSFVIDGRLSKRKS